jgi:putative ABC transport system substrate-binding protein
MMNRRAFIVTGAGLLAAPLAAQAQQAGKAPRIGYLGNSNPMTGATNVGGFRQGLRDFGLIEGQNVAIEFRWADGHFDRFPALAASLAKVPVDVIIVAGGPAIRAARQASSTIPIVAAVFGGDPVASGYVASFARPGGNLTGIAVMFEDLVTKQLQILKDVVPKASRVAILSHAAIRGLSEDRALSAAEALGLSVQKLEIHIAGDLDAALQAARTKRADITQVLPSPLFYQHRARLAALAANHRLPAIYEVRDYVVAGGLMSYGPSFPDTYRRAASYVARILKGARPGDLPIEQASTFEFVINGKAVRNLGLTLPSPVRLQVNEVIDSTP